MTDASTAALILAAGKGTRMKSDLPKVLHPVGGQPMLFHLLAGLDRLGIARRVLVIGAGRDRLEAAVANEGVALAVQEPQLGTGHAAMAAMPVLGPVPARILVLYGDTPLLRPETLAALLGALGGPVAVAVLGFRPADPGEYGRLVSDAAGRLERIVEYREASAAERAIELCNSGVMAFEGPLLPELLAALSNDNAKGEYYLTDCVALARARGRGVAVVEAGEEELLGVNDRADLARAEAVFQKRARRAALEHGVTMIAPDTVFFSHDTELAPDVMIWPHVVFGPGVRVGPGARIDGFSHLEGCEVAQGAVIGPFARLRPGARIGTGARVGNFVEIKKASLGAGAKANHLAYIGDAEIGDNANIGAGTITCNYDGFLKYRTVIGAGAFIGSNSALVAPVTIGAGAIVGAGSAISGDVPEDALALTRAKPLVREGWARAFRARKAAEKAGKGAKD